MAGPKENVHWKRKFIDMKHDHRGKSSERFLDKEVILRELNVVPGQIILDAGCGNGYMSKEFSKKLSGTGKVFALDPDREAIESLQKEVDGTHIEALVGDITETTPLEAFSIDLIYLSTVFHGFSKDQIMGFQKEAMRLLKPRARLAVVEIQKKNTPFGPPLEIRFSPEELRGTVALTPLATVDIGPYFYMQVFEKP